MNIKPSTSLRNKYNEISKLAKESQEPIYITKNGEGDLVIMDIKAFEKRDEMIRLKTQIEIAERARIYGEHNITLEEAKDYFKKLYEGKE